MGETDTKIPCCCKTTEVSINASQVLRQARKLHCVRALGGLSVYELQKGKTGADHGPALGRLAAEPVFILPSEANTLVRIGGVEGKEV